VQVDLAQELLLGCRVDFVLQSIAVGFDGGVFDVELFELVVCDVRVHLADVQWKLEANKLLCESNRNNGAER
jgi:hypothetical protein